MTASAGPVLERLYREFGGRVGFVTVYVREAHPGERYPQPATFEEKLRHARDYRERDALPWPVAVDDIDGTLHRALDGKPNAAYVMDVAGSVAFRGLWANVHGPLEQALRAVVAGQPVPERENRSKVVPMFRGMGRMDDTLGQAGQVARQDFKRAMPPVYAMARLAAVFRPLPPLGRGVAAVAVPLLGIAAVAAVALRRSR